MPDSLKFGPPGTTKIDDEGLTLSSGLILGLIAAVMGASVNADETAPKNYQLTIQGEKIITLNQLWGKPDEILKFHRMAFRELTN